MWKDAKIFLEWFYIEIKKDLFSLFDTTTSPGTYTSFIKSSIKSFRNVFFKPRNQVYWCFFFFIVALAKLNLAAIILTFILFWVVYIRKLIITGDWLKFYRERYYG